MILFLETKVQIELFIKNNLKEIKTFTLFIKNNKKEITRLYKLVLFIAGTRHSFS